MAQNFPSIGDRVRFINPFTFKTDEGKLVGQYRSEDLRHGTRRIIRQILTDDGSTIETSGIVSGIIPEITVERS